MGKRPDPARFAGINPRDERDVDSACISLLEWWWSDGGPTAPSMLMELASPHLEAHAVNVVLGHGIAVRPTRLVGEALIASYCRVDPDEGAFLSVARRDMAGVALTAMRYWRGGAAPLHRRGVIARLEREAASRGCSVDVLRSFHARPRCVRRALVHFALLGMTASELVDEFGLHEQDLPVELMEAIGGALST